MVIEAASVASAFVFRGPWQAARAFPCLHPEASDKSPRRSLSSPKINLKELHPIQTSGCTFVTKIQRNIDHVARATIAAFELFRILPIVAGAAALLDIHFHEALCYELHHQAQNINVGPLSASSASSIVAVVIVISFQD